LSPTITFLTADSQEFISEQSRIILDVMQQLEKANLPILNIVEIVVADDYSKTFTDMHENGGSEIQKRGYYSMAKNFLSEDGKTTRILFNRKFNDFRLPDSIKSLISQIADVNLPEIIPPEIDALPNTIEFNLSHDLKSILREFAIKAITYMYLNRLTFTQNDVEYRVRDKNEMSLEKIEAALNREVKRFHFKYQRDKDINAFWISIVQNLSFYCNQAIYVSHKDAKDCHLKRIYDSMFCGINAVLDHKEYVTVEIEKAVCDYLADHKLKAASHSDGQFELRILENPKDFYKKNKIVDTENRIVCFADILGFGNIVEEYDQNPNSTVLQDLKEALDFAYSTAITKFAQNSQIDYRVFSDCLCISTPYFDEEDFFTQLFVISQSIKVFQTQLMLKGFFVRGAITFGSHYEDENMIFSKALVEAYLIESNKKDDNKALYSRIALSKPLAEKLSQNCIELESRYPWRESFVQDNSDNVIFLNPFDILRNIRSNFDYMRNAFDTACEGLEDDPLVGMLKNITNTVLDSTLELFPPQIDSDEVFKPFEDMIEQKIIENAGDDRYRLKYEWLKEFLGWYKQSQKDDKFSFIFRKEQA